VRLRNKEDFAERALASIAPFFDEIIVVYNGCTDRTPEIVERFTAAEPERARAYHYVPEVFPQGTEVHRRLPADHPSSLVHYYNFALSRATRRVCGKWDGDMIAAPGPFGALIEHLRRARVAAPPLDVAVVRRILVVQRREPRRQSRPDLCLKTWPRLPGRYDCGFWPAGRAHKFKHNPRFEILRTGALIKSFAGFVFFHLKAMKKDRGAGVHQLERNPSSYYKKYAEDMRDPEVITFEEYCRIEPAARSLPDPDSLGIRPVKRTGGE
jgi:glycosyltransferase involved in cell wall biosynthesis